MLPSLDHSLSKMCDLLQSKRTRRWPRYEIVQALEVKTMVKVKQEPGEEVEPPDEVLSSPYSILKARARPCPLPAIAAKVCLSPW